MFLLFVISAVFWLQWRFRRNVPYGTFAFGSTAEAVKPPEMHHKKVPCFNSPCLFGVGGNAARPTDCEKAASLVRDTQLPTEDDMLRLQRQRSNTWIAHLEGLGNDEEQFCRNSHISLKKLHRTVMDGGAPELLKKLFGLLQVKDVTPLRLSQQYAAQEYLPDKVFYVLGGWRCRFFFRVATPHPPRSGGTTTRSRWSRAMGRPQEPFMLSLSILIRQYVN